MLDATRIALLLQPFVSDASPFLVSQLQTYLYLLLRWNARMNLTAIRDPEQIVTRHFGESLFAAHALYEAGALPPAATLADVGSGAGFPGLPIKLFAPKLQVTLIEAQHKKATFLREVVRTLGLSHIVVQCGRAENWDGRTDVVTLRAVEKFAEVLPIAGDLVAEGGTLCLLIGEAQVPFAAESLGTGWHWKQPSRIPLSEGKVVAFAAR
jgi:16S rRNA (guanine527-N7)-methyltransferase